MDNKLRDKRVYVVRSAQELVVRIIAFLIKKKKKKESLRSLQHHEEKYFTSQVLAWASS